MRLMIENDILYVDEVEYGYIRFNNDITHFNGCKFYLENHHTKNQEALNKVFKTLTKNDLIEDLYIVVITNEVFYIYKKDGRAELTSDFDFDLLSWDKSVSVKKCHDYLSTHYNNVAGLEFNIDDGNFFDIFIDNEVLDGETLHDTFLRSKKKVEELLYEAINEFNIEKTIVFSSEHLTAGSSILQYFGKLLQEKYPNENVSVSIKQEGLKVTMLIETPDGKKEEIEEYLNRYGMVVMNQLSVDEFALNPIQALELKQELRDAQNKIEFQQELLVLKDETYKNKILSLEDEVKFLREEFSFLRKLNDENIQLMLSTLLKKDKLINKLTKSIEKRDDKETKQLLLELKEKDAQGYISLKQHIDNAIVGSIVNAPSWIQFTLEIMKRMG
ncbi:hypothetical protein [Halarcobacter sp.]|uniref:hypothetical protein n=1 Tax=Halarcobacter sp. TaxID=2321133 RepID=UPI002AA7A347|nr:hypothetical protein [Halarcobacter sp.]